MPMSPLSQSRMHGQPTGMQAVKKAARKVPAGKNAAILMKRGGKVRGTGGMNVRSFNQGAGSAK